MPKAASAGTAPSFHSASKTINKRLVNHGAHYAVSSILPYLFRSTTAELITHSLALFPNAFTCVLHNRTARDGRLRQHGQQDLQGAHVVKDGVRNELVAVFLVDGSGGQEGRNVLCPSACPASSSPGPRTCT